MFWVYLTVLVWISIRDIRTKRISNFLNGLVATIGICHSIYLSMTGNGDLSHGSVATFVVFLTLLVLAVATKGAIGGGDIKLATALTFPTGTMDISQLTQVWFVVGLCCLPVYGMVLFRIISWKTAIPFAPCLAVGYLTGLV